MLSYYLNVLKRVEDQGLTRRTSQTPYEYEPTLQQTIPTAAEEVSGLTEAFVQARYSRTEVDKVKVTSVKGLWRRIKQALRRARKAKEPPPS